VWSQSAVSFDHAAGSRAEAGVSLSDILRLALVQVGFCRRRWNALVIGGAIANDIPEKSSQRRNDRPPCSLNRAAAAIVAATLTPQNDPALFSTSQDLA
jgi:hypothetical protein